MNVLEKILEEIEERIKKVNEADNMCRVNAERNRNFESVKYFQSLMFATERTESIIGDIIRSHMDEESENNNKLSNDDDYTMFTLNKDGVAEIYRDTYDIIIHCESIEEQKTVEKILERCKGWIPVEERLPEVPKELEDAHCPEFNVMIKGAEKSTTLKYSWDGAWFDDSGNVYNVIAWQPLPEPYKPKKTIPVAGMDHIMSRFTRVE